MPNFTRRKLLIGTGLVTALTLTGGGAWALDRYVVPHVEVANVAELEAAAETASAAASDSASSDPASTGLADTAADSASAEAPSVEISTVVTGSGDSQITAYVAEVALGDATQLRSAFADDSYGTNITANPSEIAAANEAIFAINGDYYGFRDTGIVIRNGVVYRDEGARTGLAFYQDGHVEVYDETATTAQALVDAGVWNTLSFGPALLEDGQLVADIESVEVDTNVGNHSIQGQQPRTAIGVIDDNHLVFVVVDGRSPGYSAGMTMTELAELMRSLGAQTAYNLDGGGSSVMLADGEMVSNPLGKGEERATSDILYIAADTGATVTETGAQ